MPSLLGRLWRRLLNVPADPGGATPFGNGSLGVLDPPDGFTPRDREVVYGHGAAHGNDPERSLDLGIETLVVTSQGIVYFTGEKRWRFAWRGIKEVALEPTSTVHIETRSGRHFSFRMASVPETEAMQQAAVAIMALRS